MEMNENAESIKSSVNYSFLAALQRLVHVPLQYQFKSRLRADAAAIDLITAEST